MDSQFSKYLLHNHHNLCISRSQGIKYDLGAVTVDPESASYDPRPLIPYLKSLGVEYLYEQQGKEIVTYTFVTEHQYGDWRA